MPLNYEVKADLRSSYLHQFARAIEADLFHQFSCAQHLWGEVVNMSDGFGANSLTTENDNPCFNSFCMLSFS